MKKEGEDDDGEELQEHGYLFFSARVCVFYNALFRYFSLVEERETIYGVMRVEKSSLFIFLFTF